MAIGCIVCDTEEGWCEFCPCTRVEDDYPYRDGVEDVTPTLEQIGGAASRAERFAANGDTDILLEGLPVEPFPGQGKGFIKNSVTVRELEVILAPLTDEEIKSELVRRESLANHQTTTVFLGFVFKTHARENTQIHNHLAKHLCAELNEALGGGLADPWIIGGFELDEFVAYRHGAIGLDYTDDPILEV